MGEGGFERGFSYHSSISPVFLSEEAGIVSVPTPRLLPIDGHCEQNHWPGSSPGRPPPGSDRDAAVLYLPILCLLTLPCDTRGFVMVHVVKLTESRSLEMDLWACCTRLF